MSRQKLPKTARQILNIAKTEFKKHTGSILNVLDIAKPSSLEEAKVLAKTVSKLSPLLGNMIEFSTIKLLNKIDWNGLGHWVRQDPGFPDALFKSTFFDAPPGIEIKAWFPFATEITARFRDSEKAFEKDNIDIALVAWIPENIIWGKPKILDFLFVSGGSVAKARDEHYHRPPDYIVLEPEDTTNRTVNLQQTNTTGHKLQTKKDEAEAEVQTWPEKELHYSPSSAYQKKLRKLMGIGVYRLDTNYAKLDRIEHAEIENFKSAILKRTVQGRSIQEWGKILAASDDSILEEALLPLLDFE